MLEVVPDEVLGQRPVGAVAAHRGLPHVPVGVDHAGHDDAAASRRSPGCPRARRGPAPTAAIRSSTTRTSASGSTLPASSMGSTVPPRRTTGRPALGRRARGGSWLLLDVDDALSDARPLSGHARPGGGHPGRAAGRRVKARADAASRTPVDSALRRRRDSSGRGGGRSSARAADGEKDRTRMTTEHPTAPGRAAAPSGLLVADFSRILAGPYATMLLADLGAEVVKVEGPGGDDTRTWAPPVRDGCLDVLPGRQPQQAVGRPGPRGPSTSPPPANWPAAPTCWWRTSSPAA